MVDTIKTLSALQTLLADNTAGDISAQDLRDFLVSAMLETDAQTVTTANVTAAAGKHYELTISGMTADRDFILPASAVVGSTISVKLMTDAPADYELVLKGAATVTINGGTAATEWSRIFIDNEVVTFRATSATNWDVVYDGRIPSGAVIEADGTNTQDTGEAAVSWTENGNLQVTASNIGCIITTGSRTTPSYSTITVRRDNKYLVSTAWRPKYAISDGHYGDVQATRVGATGSLGTSLMPGGNHIPNMIATGFMILDAGDEIGQRFRSETGEVGCDAYPSLCNLKIQEVL